jgi:hypothetical protein
MDRPSLNLADLARIPETSPQDLREDGSKERCSGKKGRRTGRSQRWRQPQFHSHRFRCRPGCRGIRAPCQEEEGLHALPSTATTEQARFAARLGRILPQAQGEGGYREAQTTGPTEGKGGAEESCARGGVYRSARNCRADRRGEEEEEEEGGRGGCLMYIMRLCMQYDDMLDEI